MRTKGKNKTNSSNEGIVYALVLLGFYLIEFLWGLFLGNE